jgi:hypothetical protein
VEAPGLRACLPAAYAFVPVFRKLRGRNTNVLIEGVLVPAMSRPTLAFLIGVVGFIAYIAVIVAVGDFVVNRHWLIQLVYYGVAGIVWVIPARWLIVWAVRGR